VKPGHDAREPALVTAWLHQANLEERNIDCVTARNNDDHPFFKKFEAYLDPKAKLVKIYAKAVSGIPSNDAIAWAKGEIIHVFEKS